MIRSKGNELVDSFGHPFLIRGASLPDVGLCYKRGTLLSKIDGVKNLGANTIRLPCYPSGIASHRQIYQFDDFFFSEILVPAIDRATEAGLHVIVDYHDIHDMNQETTDKAKIFWSKAIKKLDSYNNIIYEAYNEPINSDSTDPITRSPIRCWNAYYPYMQNLVSHIRDMTEKLIIVGTPVYCKFISPAIIVPIKSDNIAYAAHIYQLSIDEAHAKSNDKFAKKVESYYQQLRDIAICSLEHPVVITECGWSRDRYLSERWFVELEQILSEESWVAWCYDYHWWPNMFADEKETILSAFGKEVSNIFKHGY